MRHVACEVFGDETTSANDRYAIYSMVGIVPDALPKATDALATLKELFQIPPGERLHCRVIFAKHQREKTPWGRLSESQILEFMRNFGDRMQPLGLYWAYGYVDLGELSRLPNPKRIEGKFSGEEGPKFSFTFGTKQAQQFAYAAAEMPFVRRFGRTARFWCDKDGTRIEWFVGRKKPHNISRGLGAQAEIELPYNLLPMLEVADFFAYAASRHFSDHGFGQHVFRKVHQNFHPIASKLHMDPSLFGRDVKTSDWLKATSHES